jgi:hypothetical protein
MTVREDCKTHLENLSGWFEGQRSPGLSGHLRDCSDCRTLIEDLEAIRSAAPALAEADPPERIWTSLRLKMEAEGLIRAPQRSSWLDGFFFPSPRPALAGAYAGVLLIAALLVGSQASQLQHTVWEESSLMADSGVDGQLDSVEKATLATYREPNPEVSDSLQGNLRMIDNYIVLCQKSVQAMPQSEMARDYLNKAYQQKADLLAVMAARGTDNQ